MDITPTAISRCSGLNHVTITATVNGVSRTETFLRSEFDLEPGEVREAFISRMRSAIKEAGATTAAQISTALIGKNFKL
jgi:hypothetical protein